MHGYVSVLVCVFGSVANTLNIAVLTRKEMVSPTNSILTGLAVADLLVMLEYIPYAFHMYWPTETRSYKEQYNYPWACFVYFHSIFTQICHTVSIFLTVTLAVWRYIAIAHPQINRRWCNMRVTALTITAAYIVCPLICVPILMIMAIGQKEELITADGQLAKNLANISMLEPPPQNETVYYIDFIASNTMMTVIFWIYSVVIKLIPCILLTVLSSQLILVLVETKKRRQQLMAPSRDGVENVASKARRRSERQTDRTTRMLLAVLFLFLLTEFPQGIMGLLSVFLGTPFFQQCYSKLGELMDIFALVNSAINFILYCTMSRQFRATFAQLFRPRWLPVSQNDGDGDGDANGGADKTQMTQV
ncbi:G-protein coupled receptor dmsr-1-like [Arctopsyche grandis]|uniref:G-protein coupled receptor dmsr-1-like n=1 Tax=Arctopsyche grandis TaxID=121162 RepID=UPI00406D7D2E